MTNDPMTEHKGIAAVYEVCTQMSAVWRPTTTTDLGIDGQIELLEEGEFISTGRIYAAQIKSGVSYFQQTYLAVTLSEKRAGVLA